MLFPPAAPLDAWILAAESDLLLGGSSPPSGHSCCPSAITDFDVVSAAESRFDCMDAEVCSVGSGSSWSRLSMQDLEMDRDGLVTPKTMPVDWSADALPRSSPPMPALASDARPASSTAAALAASRQSALVRLVLDIIVRGIE